MPPLLSICIPTHDGRAATLEHTLREVLKQLPDLSSEIVEICISDNASADGTEALIGRLQREHPGAITYRRNPVNLGGPRNLRQVVELATGRWCWLLSSDDAPAPGALAAIHGLIERHRDASGMTLGWRAYDRTLVTPLGADRSGPPFNVGERDRVLRSAAEIFCACGAMFDYMSIHVFRTELWLSTVAQSDPELLSRTLYPTTYVLGRMCLQCPSWVWASGEMVKARAPNPSSTDHGTPDTAALRARALGDVQRIWKHLLAGDRDLRRAVAAGWVQSYARPDDLRGDRRNPATAWRSQLELLAGLGSALRFSRTFWRNVAPLLIVPGAIERAPVTVGGRLHPSPRLAPPDTRVRLAPEEQDLERALARGKLRCRVENLGSRTLRSTAPYPVHLSCRWFDPATREMLYEGQRSLLVPSLAPGRTRRYTLSLTRPPPGDYRLGISLVQEHVAWFDDHAPENGWSTTVTVR